VDLTLRNEIDSIRETVVTKAGNTIHYSKLSFGAFFVLGTYVTADVQCSYQFIEGSEIN
jgi:hypothetical protein